MHVSNAIWLVTSGFAAASCCFTTAAYWIHVRRIAADVKLIHAMADNECADWVFARYGYLVEAAILTRSQKLEVIRRKLKYKAGENGNPTAVVALGAALAVGIVALALS